ncbi:MAG TPA: hypothetical protein VFU76_02050 [Terriglobales bacterium]|nr:hypothetical protein [Terriglobales bacterium]
MHAHRTAVFTLVLMLVASCSRVVAQADQTQVTLPGRTLMALVAGNGAALLGHSVTLTAVLLRSSADRGSFLVGPNDNQQVLVIPASGVHAVAQDDHSTSLGKDALLTVRGRVEKAPPEQDLRRRWGLSEVAARSVAQQGVIVRAQEIRVIVARQ